MRATLLTLLSNQTRTLYETFYFSMLIIFCKGIGLTRDDFGRGEFNYLSMLISVIYVLDSGYYILMGAFDSVILGMYALLFVHCLVYSCYTFATLRTQREIAIAVGIESIVAANKEKSKMFR